MPGKMIGSPFHVETPQYKYATEQSEVPVTPSEFNQTITHCGDCLYWIEESDNHFVCYSENVQQPGTRHCSGYKDVRKVPNASLLRHELLSERIKQESRKRIYAIADRLLNYHYGTNAFIDGLFYKKWAFFGSNPNYDKKGLVRLINSLKGEDYSHKSLIDADYVIRLQLDSNKSMKALNKEIERSRRIAGSHETKEPQVIMFHDFCNYIEKLEKALL